MLKGRPEIDEIKGFIEVAKSISITAHRNPDGDALGSMLGLYWFLTGLGKKVTMVLPSSYPDSFNWMPGIGDVVVYDEQPDEALEQFLSPDLKFCLDFNAPDRIDAMGKALVEMEDPGKVVLIDHHIDPSEFPDVIISETSASSTCELIYHLINALGESSRIDAVIADCLFTGIITDTGSFRHATSARLYHVAGELKAHGADDYKLQDLINNCLTARQLRLLGHALYNRMEVLPEYATGIIHLTKDDYEAFDIQRGDTEGIVNYLMMIRNIRMAAFITEQPTIVKLSLRSKGDVSVQDLASKYFNGGGHKNAAGGSSYYPLESVIKKLKSLLPEYVPFQAIIHEE